VRPLRLRRPGDRVHGRARRAHVAHDRGRGASCATRAPSCAPALAARRSTSTSCGAPRPRVGRPRRHGRRGPRPGIGRRAAGERHARDATARGGEGDDVIEASYGIGGPGADRLTAMSTTRASLPRAGGRRRAAGLPLSDQLDGRVPAGTWWPAATATISSPTSTRRGRRSHRRWRRVGPAHRHRPSRAGHHRPGGPSATSDGRRGQRVRERHRRQRGRTVVGRRRPNLLAGGPGRGIS
jgi:hypothetical protein